MQFYKIFKETVERWRKQEIEAEFYCSRTRPSSNLRLTGLLKHASKIYTATLFRDFEEEFKTEIACSIFEVNQINGIRNYRYIKAYLTSYLIPVYCVLNTNLLHFNA